MNRRTGTVTQTMDRGTETIFLTALRSYASQYVAGTIYEIIQDALEAEYGMPRYDSPAQLEAERDKNTAAGTLRFYMVARASESPDEKYKGDTMADHFMHRNDVGRGHGAAPASRCHLLARPAWRPQRLSCTRE